MKLHHRRGMIALACAAALALTGCLAGTPTATPPTAPALDATGCITSFDAAKDYFPDKATFTDATNVSVTYHNSYKVVTVKQPAPGAPAESYVLVQCGAPEPQLDGDLAKAPSITIPAKRIVAGSTTHVAGYELVGRVDALAGIAYADQITDGPAKDGIDGGTIRKIAAEGMSFSVEDVASVKPDLFVTGGAADPAHAKLAELKIPVVANAEWLETTPLGRAEWIKYTSLFLNAEAKASAVYDKVRADYRATAEKASKASARPTVLTGALTQGVFYAAGAGSYVGTLIEDAGADYVLASDAAGSGSAEVALEKVIGKGAEAQFWINPSSMHWQNLTELVATDARLGELKAVKDGNVWDYTKARTANGGNEYWQMGIMRPDLVLGDLVAVFHPDLMPGHTFTYYEPMPKG